MRSRVHPPIGPFPYGFFQEPVELTPAAVQTEVDVEDESVQVCLAGPSTAVTEVMQRRGTSLGLLCANCPLLQACPELADSDAQTNSESSMYEEVCRKVVVCPSCWRVRHPSADGGVGVLQRCLRGGAHCRTRGMMRFALSLMAVGSKCGAGGWRQQGFRNACAFGCLKAAFERAFVH